MRWPVAFLSAATAASACNYGDSAFNLAHAPNAAIFWSMARLARVVIPGHPHHVTQGGNGRARTFFGEGDGVYVIPS
jgi:hypothetical protein